MKDGNPHAESDDVFAIAVSQNTCISGVIRSLKRAQVGSNYSYIKSRASLMGLDTSHWTGGPRGGATRPKKRDISILCLSDNPAPRSTVRNLIIRLRLIDYKCDKCSIESWMGEKISLELDHKNGDRVDHRLENLRWLCPNCHSQTDTYCGKNITAHKNTRKLKNQKNKCACGEEKPVAAKMCRSCAAFSHNKTKINWPSDEDLIFLVESSSYVQAARHLGVSDVAIRKRLQRSKKRAAAQNLGIGRNPCTPP